MSPTRSKTGKLRLRRVALLIETSRTYGRGILRGIARYAHLHGQWSFFTVERELHSGIPDWLRRWKGDGIIARVESRTLEEAIRRTTSGGSTSLYNALYISLKELKRTQARSTEEIRRQAVVVPSDGEDTSSLLSYEEVLE